MVFLQIYKMLGIRRLYDSRILVLILTISFVHSKHKTKSEYLKTKNRIHQSRSKIKIDKGNPWPFLPSPGKHYTEYPGYPSYPFLILAPPNLEPNSEDKLKAQQGSKYYNTRRQSMSYPLQTVPNYAPVYYYIIPQYLTYPSPYTNYYQGSLNQPFYSQYDQTYGQTYDQTYGITQPYNMNPVFFKRSHTKKHHVSHGRRKPMKRQFVPRHHWAFSQWPFDSHEYAFTKDPIYSSNAPHLPRWGPIEWGGVGPGKHWARNREGLPSPFGIGLAPHMGGQGYIGLGGHWPGGEGYPLPTNFPKSPLTQHDYP